MTPERGASPDSSTARAAPTPREGRLLAICLHAPPTGPPHFDVFLGPEGPCPREEHVLETWRSPCDPRLLEAGGSVELTPIGRHRGLYLQLSERRELDRNRGLVTPVARGEVRVASGTEGRELQVDWLDGGRSVFILTPLEAGLQRLLRR